MNSLKAQLRKRPSFDEIMGYINTGQEIIKYPDRTASILRNSPYLGKFDGLFNSMDLQDQEEAIQKEKLKETQVQQIARESGTTRALVEMQTQTDKPFQPNRVSTSRSSTQTDRPSQGSYGTQTDRPSFAEFGVQADPPPPPAPPPRKVYGSFGTQTDTRPKKTYGEFAIQTDLDNPPQPPPPPPAVVAQQFDMAADDAKEEYLDYLMAATEQQENADLEKREKIKQIVENHLGRKVDDIPYYATKKPKPRISPYARGPKIEDESEQPSTSSSSNQPAPQQPMEVAPQRRRRKKGKEFNKMVVNEEETQQKRAPDEAPSEPRKRMNKKQTFEAITLPEPEQALKPPVKAKPKPKSRRQKTEPKFEELALPDETKPEQNSEPQTEAKAEPKTKTKAKAKAKPVKQVGVEKIEGKDAKWWKGKSITVLKQQAELRGHRFTDAETKGGTRSVNGAKTKFQRFKKDDYYNTLMKILKLN